MRTVTEAAGISMSEIASCSYEARAKGVKNGMFMGSALKLCPELGNKKIKHRITIGISKTNLW